MEKILTTLNKLSLIELKKLITTLNERFDEGADLTFDIAINVLEERTTGEDFIDFCETL